MSNGRCPRGHIFPEFRIKEDYIPGKGYFCQKCHSYYTGGDFIYWSDHLNRWIGGDRDHGTTPDQMFYKLKSKSLFEFDTNIRFPTNKGKRS